ncbi:MAG TPA: NAD(P)/FAD-dependent oxidoreductase [Pseudonocardia sp.]|jgi:2-polyprenyl-6-methoxyphenol hydroxylase-like FAD-dependent oxidoreductase|nr:NAD(P)/FAD-dependent oxidoreductase [Pseudonocardia sp.]
MRVIIIGAGLGGLTLAHGLRTAGVEVAVYERSPRNGPQPASYGIHINAHGNRALHACLPAENWAMFDVNSVSAPDVVRFRDRNLEVLTDLQLATSADDADPISHRRAVRRQALHRSLCFGLEEVIGWDKTFESYTGEPDGRVRVTFADGSQTGGDLLVGADGSNSRVRQQYLPALARHDLGILNVAGRLPLSHAAAQAMPGDMVDGSVNNIVPKGPGWLFASTWPASIRQIGTGVEHGAPGEDFLVWAHALNRDAYPSDIDQFSAEALRRWVAERVAGWDPRVAAIIRASDPATIGRVPLRSMSRLPSWRPSNVTVLGDAIHNMTPMAGIGANTALRDADNLRMALTNAGGETVSDRVGRYEAQMREYANVALALSTRNARNAASPRRLPRIAFRALLRAADALPPVKRAVFPTAKITAKAS